MRICFVSSYPPSKEGVGEYTSRLVGDLSDKNVKISVITFSGKHVEGENNIFRIISTKRRSKQLFYNTLTDIKPDIIHVQYAVPIFKFLSFVIWPSIRKYQKESGCKLVVTLHEPKKELAYFGIMIKPFYRWLGYISDQIWVLTSGSKHLLVANCNVNPNKVKVIPHGLYSFKDYDGNGTDFKQIYNLNGKKVLLFFGYIHINKGLQFLIDAFAEISKNPAHKNVHLIIAGTVRPRSGMFRVFELIDHVYKLRVKRKISLYSLDNKITWTGYVEKNDIYSIFQTADVIILPYTKAEQSGVLNIALTSEKPIIASNIGGFAEMLSNVGALVPVGEPAKIAKALDEILENPSRSISLAEKYKQIQTKFSQENVSKQFNLYYEELFNA